MTTPRSTMLAEAKLEAGFYFEEGSHYNRDAQEIFQTAYLKGAKKGFEAARELKTTTYSDGSISDRIRKYKEAADFVKELEGEK